MLVRGEWHIEGGGSSRGEDCKGGGVERSSSVGV
jgi:hypothetical protein